VSPKKTLRILASILFPLEAGAEAKGAQAGPGPPYKTFFFITGFYWVIKCEDRCYIFLFKEGSLKLSMTLLLISFEFTLDLRGKEKKYKGITF
jgi:hypothetical protein